MNDLPELNNESADLFEFRWLNPRHTEPDAAWVKVSDTPPENKVAIDIFPEDRKAIAAAGYAISADPKQQEIVPVILAPGGRKIDFVVDKHGELVEIDRANLNAYRSNGTPIGAPRTEPTHGSSAVVNMVPAAPTGKASLYAKMARVMGSVGAVPKSGKGQDSGGRKFDYRTSDDLYTGLRSAMADARLALFPTIDEHNRDDGKLTEVKVQFTLADGDSGETIVASWIGRSYGPPDKAISMAITNAEKYFLQSTFLISTGDPSEDPDAPQNNVPATQQAPHETAPQPAPKSSPKTAPKQEQPAPSTEAWAISDTGVTELMFGSRDWPQSSAERMNTITAMRSEGAFDPITSYREAEAALKARLASPAHGKTSPAPTKPGKTHNITEGEAHTLMEWACNKADGPHLREENVLEALTQGQGKPVGKDTIFLDFDGTFEQASDAVKSWVALRDLTAEAKSEATS